MTRGCNTQELTKAFQFLNQTFEDGELHVANGAYVGFLGAVLEKPRFGKPGPLKLVMVPGLPASLQIALTLLGLGFLDLNQAGSLSSQGDSSSDTRLALPSKVV